MSFGNFVVENGKPLPLGAAVTERGVNFALFARNAAAVTLILFESPDPRCAYEKIPLDKEKNRTGDIWHCHIPGLEAGALYLYQVDGPYIPEKGLRFNAHKALFDPYAKALTDLGNWDVRS
jgi:glycogen operon protein